MPFIGDTVKLRVEFKTFAGVAVDPATITLKIYDYDKTLLTTVDITSTYKISTGVYEYNYTIPDGSYPAIVYEFSGTNVEGSVALSRGKAERKWV